MDILPVLQASEKEGLMEHIAWPWLKNERVSLSGVTVNQAKSIR